MKENKTEKEKIKEEGKTEEVEAPPRPGHWFKLLERSLWHSLGHVEYGVIWSKCGLRTLDATVEKREGLEASESICVKCLASLSGKGK